MSGVNANANEVDIDIAALFAAVWRRKLRILLVALIVSAGAFAIANTMSPKYMAETRILIETRESIYTRPNIQGQQGDNRDLDQESVASQVELISSTALLNDVAAKFNLAQLSEFNKPSGFNLPFLSMGDNDTLEDRVLSRMREKLKVYRVEGSRVIVVSFSSKNPQLVADIPNAIAKAYIEFQGQAKQESNTRATEWLEPEIQDLRARVKQAETKVADYRAAHDIPLGQNNSALATQQLSELSSELSRVRASRAATEARAQSIQAALRSGGAVDSIPEVQTSSLIQRLIEKQVDLRAQIADLSTTLLDNHPRIKALRSQLEQLNSQVRAEAGKVVSGLNTEAETARIRENQLIADLNRLKAESARVDDKEVELHSLEREAAAQRDLLESYLTRYREAKSREERDYSPVDARIFSPATVPGEPYFPKKVPIAGAAFVASLLLMTVFTLLSELFSGRAMRATRPAPAPAPVQQVAMPAVQPQNGEHVPLAARAAASAAAHAAASPVGAQAAISPSVRAEPRAGSALGKAIEEARARRDIAPEHPGLPADQLAARLIDSGASRAIFVSPEGDEAASAAIRTARILADSGLRIVLMDLTGHGVAAMPMLETRNKPGTTDLLASEASFSEVIHGDLFSECHVIPSGVADAGKALGSIERLPIILDALAQVYDLIVVECGPTDAAGIRRLLNASAEVVLSVVRQEDPAVVATAGGLIAAGHENLLIANAADGGLPQRPLSGRNAA